MAVHSRALSEAPCSATAQGSIPWLVLEGCWWETPWQRGVALGSCQNATLSLVKILSMCCWPPFAYILLRKFVSVFMSDIRDVFLLW